MPRKLVDMARTPREQAEEINEGMPVAIATARYPYGLCLCLDDHDLEKIDLANDMEAGDMITFTAMAKVTSVSSREIDGEVERRVELQITGMSIDE